MKILATLRSVYLYAALSIATGAMLIALVALASLGLELLGLTDAPPTADSIRERVSGGAATALFALPVAAVHAWLIRMTLRDPLERTSGPRHFFLNAWIVAGLAETFIALVTVSSIAIVDRSPAVSIPLASLVAGIGLTLGAWRWRESTPGAARIWQILGAFGVLLVATLFGVTEVMALMAALAGGVVGVAGRYPPPSVGWSAAIGIVAWLVMWTIGLRWLWPARDVTFRTIYAATGFGIGLALLTLTGTDEVARVLALIRGDTDAAVLARHWTEPVVGAYLVALHLPWLATDRSRIALPPRVTDRVVRGISALVGLTVLAVAWWAAWSWLAQDVLRIGPAVPVRSEADIPAGDEAVAATILGVPLYLIAWTAFVVATRGDARSGLRRAYVLTVTCLSLLGTIVLGVIAVSNAISLVMGAAATAELVRTTIDSAGAGVGLAVVLIAHVILLLRDIRSARAALPLVATIRPREDPLTPLLEAVARGTISPADAAARIRCEIPLIGRTA